VVARFLGGLLTSSSDESSDASTGREHSPTSSSEESETAVIAQGIGGGLTPHTILQSNTRAGSHTIIHNDSR